MRGSLLCCFLLALLAPVHGFWKVEPKDDKYSSVPDYADPATKTELENIRNVVDGLYEYNQVYYGENGHTSGIYFWKKVLELKGSPFCVLEWNFVNFRRVLKGLQWLGRLLKICSKTPKVKKYCVAMKPVQEFIKLVEKGEQKLHRKCQASQKIARYFVTGIAWWDTLSWPMVMLVRPALFYYHEVTIYDIKAVQFFKDLARRRKLLLVDGGYANASATFDPSRSAFHDLKMALREEKTLPLQSKKIANRLIKAHQAMLTNMTAAEFFSAPSMHSFNHRNLGLSRTSVNPGMTSMTNAFNTFLSSFETMNDYLLQDTLVSAVETTQDIIDNQLEPVLNGGAVTAISEFLERYDDWFHALDEVTLALEKLSCPDNLRYVCDLDGLALEYIYGELGDVLSIVTDVIDDITGINLDFEAIVDLIPDLDAIFDVDALTAALRAPFPAVGNLLRAIEFDPIQGIFSNNGIDDTTAFGGLEFRQASGLSPELSIDCSTNGGEGEKPVVVKAGYRTINCLEYSDDFSAQILRPCTSGSRSCNIDVSSYVSNRCRQSTTSRSSRLTNALDLAGGSTPSFDTYFVLYTCATDSQVEDMDYMPPLITVATGSFSCSSSEQITIDGLVTTDPCTDSAYQNGAEFSSQVTTYCKYDSSTWSVVNEPIWLVGWNRGIDVLAELKSQLQDVNSVLTHCGTSLAAPYSWCINPYCTNYYTNAYSNTRICTQYAHWVDASALADHYAARLDDDLRCVCGFGTLGLEEDHTCNMDSSLSPSNACDHLKSYYSDTAFRDDIFAYQRELTKYVNRRNDYNFCDSSLPGCDGLSGTCSRSQCSTIQINYACLEEGRDYVTEASEDEKTAIAFVDAVDRLENIELSCSFSANAFISVMSIEYGEQFTYSTGSFTGCNGQNTCSVPASSIVATSDTTIRVNYNCYCGAGFYKEVKINSSTGSLYCEPIPAGSYRSATMEDPEECPVGYYSTEGASECTPCARGTYSPLEGAQECFACESGTVQTSLGQPSCTPCPEHHYAPSGAQYCQFCPPGEEAPGTGNSACSVVGRGYIASNGSGARPCRPGQYQDEDGQWSCKMCGPGTYSPNYAATACEPCPVNTYADTMQNSRCAPCPNGQITTYPGQVEDTCFLPVLEFDYRSDEFAALTCNDLLLLDVTSTDEIERADILRRRQEQTGDGFCNGGPWNTPQCGYDSGDCCASTCTVPTNSTTPDLSVDFEPWKLSCNPSTFACLDPEAFATEVSGCASGRLLHEESSSVEFGQQKPTLTQSNLRGTTQFHHPQRRLIGTAADGICDDDLNNEENDYDGGDCCEETCIAPEDSYGCFRPWIESMCKDPTIIKPTSIAGNGICDEDLNNADHFYDGGDCCWQTCVERDGVAGDCVGLLDAQCLDPDVLSPDNGSLHDVTPPNLYSSLGSFEDYVIEVDGSFPALAEVPIVTATDEDPCFDGHVDFVDTYNFQCPLATASGSWRWVSTDPSGNERVEEVSFTLSDHTPPVITGDFTEITFLASARASWPQQTVLSTDNDPCYDSAAATITYTQTEEEDCENMLGPVHFLTRRWEVTDASGNTATQSRTIDILDDVPPVLTAAGFNFGEVRLPFEDLPAPGTVTASDEDPCTSSLNVMFEEAYPEGACLADEPQVLRSWTALDRTGNIASETLNITLYDDKKPTLTDTTYGAFTGATDGLEVDLQVEYYIADVPAPPVVTASDNDPCFAGAVEYHQEPEMICGTMQGVSRSWSVSDATGNTASVSVLFSVKDDVAPVLTGDFSTKHDIEAKFVPTTQTVAASDDDPCYDAASSVVFTETIIAGICANSYTIERLWEATDSSGNYASALESINVVDTLPPSMPAPVRYCVRAEQKQMWIKQDILLFATDDCGDNAYCDSSATTRAETCTSNQPTSSMDSDGDFDCWTENPDGSGEEALYFFYEWLPTTSELSHRIYTATFVATDSCGNSASTTAEFLIPHPDLVDFEVAGSSWDSWTMDGCDEYITVNKELQFHLCPASSTRNGQCIRYEDENGAWVECPSKYIKKDGDGWTCTFTP